MNVFRYSIKSSQTIYRTSQIKSTQIKSNLDWLRLETGSDAFFARLNSFRFRVSARALCSSKTTAGLPCRAPALRCHVPESQSQGRHGIAAIVRAASGEASAAVGSGGRLVFPVVAASAQGQAGILMVSLAALSVVAAHLEGPLVPAGGSDGPGRETAPAAPAAAALAEARSVLAPHRRRQVGNAVLVHSGETPKAFFASIGGATTTIAVIVESAVSIAAADVVVVVARRGRRSVGLPRCGDGGGRIGSIAAGPRGSLDVLLLLLLFGNGGLEPRRKEIVKDGSRRRQKPLVGKVE